MDMMKACGEHSKLCWGAFRWTTGRRRWPSTSLVFQAHGWLGAPLSHKNRSSSVLGILGGLQKSLPEVTTRIMDQLAVGAGGQGCLGELCTASKRLDQSGSVARPDWTQL